METLVANGDGDDQDRIDEQFALIEQQLQNDFISDPLEARPGDVQINTLGKHSGYLILSRSNVHLRAFRPMQHGRFYN